MSSSNSPMSSPHSPLSSQRSSDSNGDTLSTPDAILKARDVKMTSVAVSADEESQQRDLFQDIAGGRNAKRGGLLEALAVEVVAHDGTKHELLQTKKKLKTTETKLSDVQAKHDDIETTMIGPLMTSAEIENLQGAFGRQDCLINNLNADNDVLQKTVRTITGGEQSTISYFAQKLIRAICATEVNIIVSPELVNKVMPNIAHVMSGEPTAVAIDCNSKSLDMCYISQREAGKMCLIHYLESGLCNIDKTRLSPLNVCHGQLSFMNAGIKDQITNMLKALSHDPLMFQLVCEPLIQYIDMKTARAKPFRDMSVVWCPSITDHGRSTLSLYDIREAAADHAGGPLPNHAGGPLPKSIQNAFEFQLDFLDIASGVVYGLKYNDKLCLPQMDTSMIPSVLREDPARIMKWKLMRQYTEQRLPFTFIDGAPFDAVVGDSSVEMRDSQILKNGSCTNGRYLLGTKSSDPSNWTSVTYTHAKNKSDIWEEVLPVMGDVMNILLEKHHLKDAHVVIGADLQGANNMLHFHRVCNRMHATNSQIKTQVEMWGYCFLEFMTAPRMGPSIHAFPFDQQLWSTIDRALANGEQEISQRFELSSHWRAFLKAQMAKSSNKQCMLPHKYELWIRVQ